MAAPPMEPREPAPAVGTGVVPVPLLALVSEGALGAVEVGEAEAEAVSTGADDAASDSDSAAEVSSGAASSDVVEGSSGSSEVVEGSGAAVEDEPDSSTGGAVAPPVTSLQKAAAAGRTSSFLFQAVLAL